MAAVWVTSASPDAAANRSSAAIISVVTSTTLAGITITIEVNRRTHLKLDEIKELLALAEKPMGVPDAFCRDRHISFFHLFLSVNRAIM